MIPKMPSDATLLIRVHNTKQHPFRDRRKAEQFVVKADDIKLINDFGKSIREIVKKLEKEGDLKA
jgi:hypothetical protein